MHNRGTAETRLYLESGGKKSLVFDTLILVYTLISDVFCLFVMDDTLSLSQQYCSTGIFGFVIQQKHWQLSFYLSISLSLSVSTSSSCQLPSLFGASWEVKLRNYSECSVKSLLTYSTCFLLHSPVES